ncbi:IctB family putative bicarbonate transporter [Synechococcus sp. CBW1004]|jgi:putative inorganic carbon (HCO3(-)) transporter|uniref:IctB family putative bicarbonate transporter n=1 Tax=Synechococcus sp. CBW1004 TaxID=1353136 RepID=UPI0018CF6D28|nr:IctB family putative bicarbonate transporter [Synechococcus sp. CBW1004]QPN62218.1 putative bicarbonate transporter, IctB family [Synechococcus sp. CBW1004]
MSSPPSATSPRLFPTPWLLRWQGLLASWHGGWLAEHLPLLAGWVLVALMASLPVITRAGLTLLITACGLLWLLWALRTPPGRIGAINAWLLLVLGLAVLATGFSPVPLAAFKGLLKLVSYLGVYALMRQLLASAPLWWDRIAAALLAGELLTSVIGIRQLYAAPGALARWSDANSVAQGTVRIYSTLDNPNLLGGYLLPILPLALVALLRWQGRPQRLFALVSLVLGVVALVLTYSRGAWMGMVAGLGTLALLLIWRAIRHWPLFWRRTLPVLLVLGGAAVLVVLVTQVEPLRVRVMSLVAGREDSSNNFRMNVWTAVLEMIQDRPWIGIGPGNSAFNLIYPLYQQPKFNALSAYSIPLEWTVEAGIPGLLAGVGLFLTAVRTGLAQWRSHGPLVLPSLAAVAVFVALAIQGLTDTIFFRPEVQLVALFSLATVAASVSGVGASRREAEGPQGTAADG